MDPSKQVKYCIGWKGIFVASHRWVGGLDRFPVVFGLVFGSVILEAGGAQFRAESVAIHAK
jgi:hypothetical protein